LVLHVAYTTRRIPLYSKINCTDPCDTAQIGSFNTPHEKTTENWHIVWTDINQKRLSDAVGPTW